MEIMNMCVVGPGAALRLSGWRFGAVVDGREK